MSKSLGNYIGVAEPPNEIFGKVMSIPDELLMNYFELITDVSDRQLKEIRQELAQGNTNPMVFKKQLAGLIITQMYDQPAASEAEAHFNRVFQQRDVPEEITEYRVSFREHTGPDGLD